MTGVDYDVVVFRILDILYKRLDYGDKKLAFARLFGDYLVSDGLLLAIFENLESRGYIKGLSVNRGLGGELIDYDLSGLRITDKGLIFLRDNEKMKDFKKYLRMA